MRTWFWTLLLVGIDVLRLSAAEACLTVRLPSALVGYPKDGSTGVPTNVVPILDRTLAWIADPAATGTAFELTSAAGETIAPDTT